MGHFQLFSMILKFSMGHFLSFYTDFYGPSRRIVDPGLTALQTPAISDKQPYAGLNCY